MTLPVFTKILSSFSLLILYNFFFCVANFQFAQASIRRRTHTHAPLWKISLTPGSIDIGNYASGNGIRKLRQYRIIAKSENMV